MRDKKIIPVFGSEAEEAQWWFDNRETFARDLKQALADGTAGVGTVARRMQQQSARITLDAEDVARAHDLAGRLGIDYETYLRNLLHDELQREWSLIEAATTADATQTAA